MSETTAKKSGLFTPLALTTSLLTIGLIVFGAVVRVTDSGLGCGNEWPLCDGTIVPPLDNITAWIEWLHRLFAALIGLFGLGMLFTALRAYRNRNRSVLIATALAAFLFTMQSALGALVVIYDLPSTIVTAHLGSSMLLLGALLMATIGSVYVPKTAYARDSVTLLAYATTGLALVIILTGALVRGSGATLACTDWPLCSGQVLPLDDGRLPIVHMTHRFAVAGLGFSLLLLVWYTYKTRTTRAMRWLAVGALVAYSMQALVGALFVWSLATPLWGAVHVGLAATTWATLVCFSVMDTYNTRERFSVELSEEQEWKPQSSHSRS